MNLHFFRVVAAFARAVQEEHQRETGVGFRRFVRREEEPELQRFGLRFVDRVRAAERHRVAAGPSSAGRERKFRRHQNLFARFRGRIFLFHRLRFRDASRRKRGAKSRERERRR